MLEGSSGSRRLAIFPKVERVFHRVIRKCIIAFLDESGRVPTYTVMLNPTIIAKSGLYETEEGCLSLLGGPRKCKRYKTIKVQYQTMEMQTRAKNFTGWTAQIIQHEVDHCNGVLI